MATVREDGKVAGGGGESEDLPDIRSHRANKCERHMSHRVHYFVVVSFLFCGCSAAPEGPSSPPPAKSNPRVVLCFSFWDCSIEATASVAPPSSEPSLPESDLPPIPLPEEPELSPAEAETTMVMTEPQVTEPAITQPPEPEETPVTSAPEPEVAVPPTEDVPDTKIALPEGDAPKGDSPEDDSPKEETLEEPKIVVEEPNDFADRFLGSDDEVKITYGINGGFGSHLFPQIVYGMPWTGGKDVVALGGGGSLLIKLNGFLVADGEGVDFTIFENPAHSKKLKGNLPEAVFAERAKVSVSQDGEKFYGYPCDVDNAADFYPGCAGVGEVFALQDPSDPTVSGGDHYDLAEVGLPWVQYIRIEDLDTCQPGDPTYETQQFKTLCKGPGIQGFDLDAMAIVNGVKQQTITK